jgi:hypothetical protein
MGERAVVRDIREENMSYRADDDGDIWDDETNTVHGPELIAGRISHIQQICRRAVERDADAAYPNLTNRAWLAKSVLNILAGNIDEQIISELTNP